VKWIIAFHGILNLGAMFITPDPWLINARGFYFSPSSSMASHHQTARTWQWIMWSPRAVPTKTVLDTWKYSVHMHYTHTYALTHLHTHKRTSLLCGRSNNTEATAKWPSCFHVVLTLRCTAALASTIFEFNVCDAIRPMSGKYYLFESKWL